MHIGFLSLLTHYTFGAKKVLLGKHLTSQILTSDYGFPWGNTIELLKQQDLNIFNPQPSVEPIPQDAADVASKILKTGNIHAINAANHFLLDADLKAVLKELHDGNVKTVGIGADTDQARQALIIKKNNMRIGIIGFTCNKEFAHHKGGAIFYAPFGDANALKEYIGTIKQDVDVLIALIQWGSEQPEPTDTYRQYAHALIDLGIDIIHGESEHVYLGVEQYNNKLIIYDSGDFVEDLLDAENNTQRSFIYTITLENDGIKQLTLTPIVIQENQLQLATGQNKIEALSLMQEISKNLGTSISDKGIITF